MSVSIDSIETAKSLAALARDNLTIRIGTKHHAKICCLCDRQMLYGDDTSLNLEMLKSPMIYSRFAKTPDKYTEYQIPEAVYSRIDDYYTLKCMTPNDKDFKWLKNLFLSPRSYVVDVTKIGLKRNLGCCRVCKGSVTSMSSKYSTLVLPKFSIANGLMIGETPRELLCLNDVEVALISLARIDLHVFSIEGGSHKQMKGWHSMYATNVGTVSRTANWCIRNLDRNEEDSENDNFEEDSDIEDDDTNEEQLHDINASTSKLAKICVILSGPFTSHQMAVARQQTNVNWGRVQDALMWLKTNNHLYRDIEINREDYSDPIFIGRTEEVESSNSVIERVYDMVAVFPDDTDNHSGGCATRQGFKEITLERMIAETGSREARLIGRPTTTLLKDYQGDNLMKAFPLQFPYGIGSRNEDGEERAGVSYFKFLSLLASSQNQRADFVCVLHNMFERQRMLSNSYLQTQYYCEDFTQINSDEINHAVDRFTEGSSGSGLADLFLKKMTAVTKSMAHTHAAAKQARQQLYAQMAKMGLPALLFTVTPSDEYNFRITIYRHTDSGVENPPGSNSTVSVLRTYLQDCRELRRDYPGFCATDYENVMRVTIEHLLGWDMEKKENKPYGLFGDVDGWCLATEEQGRKTLHGHILVWLKEWSSLYSGLGSNVMETRSVYASKLRIFCAKISSTEIFGDGSKLTGRPCQTECVSKTKNLSQRYTGLEVQDVRNLRSRCGTTSLGDKTIVKCNDCGGRFTSEDVAIQQLIQIFGRTKILNDDIRPTYDDDFWEKNLYVSSSFVLMESEIMNALLPNTTRRKNDEYKLDPYQKQCIGIARNLHRSTHSNKCFKQVGGECRMKIPSQSSGSFDVLFRDSKTRWCSFNGVNSPRSLFTVMSKRSHLDLFANLHSPAASEIWGCNSNVVAGVDGGSPMYMTAYHSKNNQKEDSKKTGAAARHMIKKMKERLEEHQINGDGNDEDIDKFSLGLRTMIGAVLMSTNAHTCSSPMAAYITRNESRFTFSHEFSYVRLKDFENISAVDYGLSSDDNGTTFLKSNVANYLRRPKELETTNLYDFIAMYSVSRPKEGSLSWFGDHPSRNHLAVNYLKTHRIPLINYFDFVDTNEFEGENMLICEIPVNLESRHISMEAYCRSACIAFVPFRDIEEDLKIDNSFHKKFQEYVRNGRLDKRHEEVLQNIQNCYNSVKAGRPMDALERVTTNVYEEKNCSNEMNEEIMDELLSEVLDETSTFEQFCCPTFRNGTNQFSFKLNQTSVFGTHRCGSQLCVTPNVSMNSNVIRENGTNRSNESNLGNELQAENRVYPSILHSLALRGRERIIDTETGKNVPLPNGTLKNIRAYGKVLFGNDVDQLRGFECIVASFVLKLHRESKRENEETFPNVKRRKMKKIEDDLARVNRGDQLICFMSGPGGSGKSHVIKAVVRYAKKFCELLMVRFDLRSITVTALTGAAAVSILGETTHSACALNRQIKQSDIEEWKKSYLVIIDEISFGSKELIEKLDKKCRSIMERPNEKFGGLDIVFAGDFSQLRPVKAKPLFLEENFIIWDDWVHSFFELRTNHRFKNDAKWGKLLTDFRDKGPTVRQVQNINSRVVGSENGPKETDLPSDVCYATKTNIDRMAINEGIFLKHLESTHSKDPSVMPPKHTICIKGGNLQWKKGRNEYKDLNNPTKDILYSCVGDAHIVCSAGSKRYDPLLKLYHGRPIVVNENSDVRNGVANGTLCKFESIELQSGVTLQDLEIIVIDGYHVWCASQSQISTIKVRLVDGLTNENEIRYVDLKAEQRTGKCEFPLPLMGEITKSTPRYKRTLSMKQFPINIGNARTIHKLQGRSLDNIVISSWDYTDNWVYVALSRVKELKGLFLRIPLEHSKCRGMSVEVRMFMEKLRRKGAPEEVEIHI